MKFIKKFWDWIRGVKKESTVKEMMLESSAVEELSEILFDENFKSSGLKPVYRGIEIDIYQVDDNLKGEKGRRFVKTLKYDEIKFSACKKNKNERHGCYSITMNDNFKKEIQINAYVEDFSKNMNLKENCNEK